MKKIVVLTDLSANSRAGIKFGLQLAAQGEYELEFYHAVEVTKPTSWNDRHFAVFSKQKKEEFDEKVRSFVASAGDEAGYDARLCKVTVDLGLKVPEKVIAYAKKSKAAFICLGTRGGGSMKKIFGSVAAELMTSSPVPVIAVPPAYKASAITNVMYASDFENLGQEIKKVKVLSDELGARLSVVHFDRTLVISDNVSFLKRKASRYVSDNTSFNFLKLHVDQSLPEQLGKEIKKKKPSVLVLFTKAKRSWFRRLFMPGNSEQMVLKPGLPIVVYRKKE